MSRELLKQINSLTFLVLGEETLDKPEEKPKIKKSALFERVGIGAEKRRAAITLNIEDTPKKPYIEEELAPEDGALYDSDFQLFIDLTRPDEQKEGTKLNSVLIKATSIKNRKIGPKKTTNLKS